MAFSLKKRALAVLTAFAMAFSLFAGASAAYADEAGAVGGAASADRDAFRDAIAATFVDSADTWTVMDMAAYAAIDGTTVATSDEARQGALNALVTMAANGSSSLSNRAAVEIVARSIGVDSTQLYQVNATEPIDNAAALAASDVTAEGYYTAPYILLAADQGNLALSDGQVASLLDVIEGGMGDGLFGYEWDGITYTSPDTSGIVLSALASRVDSDPQAQRIVDTILAALPTAQGDDGSFGSANTDAFVIIGLLAVGEDPFAMTSDSGASVVDGLMSYANVETASFQYAGEDNALATEQGFRALVALSLATVGTPFNVYDFSATQVAPGRATGEGAVDPAPEPGTGDPIEVAVSIKAGDDAWVEGAQVQVAGGSMVYHALMQAIEDAGIEQTGAESGYISSMTYNGVTLEEFGDGPNSGWLYTLNGVRPEVSITGQVLADGDAIVLFYTDDWTALDTPPFPDIAGHWAYDAIVAAYDQGVMTGMGDTGLFEPETPLSRAMLATVLYRLAGEPAVDYPASFADFDADAWYAAAVAWAEQAQIVTGYEDGTGRFGPDDPVTREQMATMLMRYAAFAGADTSARADLSAYPDADQISAFAVEAMSWANALGLITGDNGVALEPLDGATRAEAATVLVRYLDAAAE